MHKLLKKSVILLLALVMAFSSAGHVFAAQEEADIAGLIKDILDQRMEKAGAKSLQELVWYYADNAGKGEEWYVVSLRQQYPGELDFSEYRKAYEAYALTIGEKSYSTRLKAAMTLQAIGSNSSFIDQALEDSTGKGGIMTWIYGLHVANNGAKSSSFTTEKIIAELLALQLEDGGWAVMGDNGDVDVTAMSVQALAPHCSDEKVKAAVDRAVDLLPKRQKDNGYFTSFGDDNAESTAQVLTALSVLGIDCRQDVRFIKGGKTILDILARFGAGKGAYAHTVGAAANESATVQTFYALVSFDMMLTGKGSLYVFGEFTEPHVERPEKEPSGDGKDPSGDKTDPSEDGKKTPRSIKPLLYGITAAAAVIAYIALVIMKKRSYKSYLFVLIVAAVAAAGITFINIENPSDYYGGEDDIKDPVKTEIYISAATVAGEAKHIPADGIILAKTEIVIDRGQNALDQLVSAAKKYTIQIELKGGYVAGIANIYELDHGDLSGWMFRVNGEFSSVNANELTLNEGDFVEWLYTKNIGKDIGNEYTGD